MSVTSNTSSSKNIMNKSDLLAILSTMESQMSALRTMLDAVPDRKKAGRPSTKKAAAPAPAPAPAPVSDTASTVSKGSKPKGEINPQIVEYNKDRVRIFADLRTAWIAKNPSLADLAKAAWVDLPETAEKAAKKAHNKAVKDFKEAVKTANAEAPPTYPDALKEHSRRLKETKAAATATATAVEPSKKPSKKSAKSADTPAPVADSVSVASSTEPSAKKRRGRPAMTDEEKAAAKAARKVAKKAAKKAAELPPLPPSPVMDGDSLDTDSDTESDTDL